jgi:O-antigen/teichoic acid export membrane protein
MVFGSAYAPAQGTLHVLLCAVPFIYLNSLLSVSLIALGHERFYAGATALCTVVNLGLNLLLVPRWGATAAAWVAVATAGVLFLACVVGLREVGPIVPFGSTVTIAAVGALAAAFGLWAMSDRPLERGALALALSAVLWEAAGPWPLRKLLGARALSS